MSTVCRYNTTHGWKQATGSSGEWLEGGNHILGVGSGLKGPLGSPATRRGRES